MADLLYLGDKFSGYFVQDVAKNRKLRYLSYETGSSVKEITNNVMWLLQEEVAKPEYIVINPESFLDEAFVIADEIEKLSKAIHATPIIYLKSYSPDSEMARAFLDHDIKRFIYYGNTSDLIDQLEKNITGYYDANRRQEIEEVLKAQEELRAKINAFQSIGIAGTMARCGCTSCALQVVKYLQKKGYKACYVELNDAAYFDMTARDGAKRSVSFVAKYAIWTQQEEKAAVHYQGIDLFRGKDLAEAQERGYDYFVFDYGNMFSETFDRNAFIKDDVKIIVGGAGPIEFDTTLRALTLAAYRDATLVLAFTNEAEREDILNTLHTLCNASGMQKRKICFMANCTDPFCLLDDAVYEEILGVEAKPGSAQKGEKARFSLFGKGRKK